MEVKVYASKSTLGLVALVCLILVVVFAYFGIGKRFEDVEANKDYQYTNGVVREVSKHEYRDDDGDLDYNYEAILEVQKGIYR